MGMVSRWVVAVAGSLACFGGCWGGLAVGRVLDTGSQVGVAAVPLVVVMTVLGAWAERAREKKPESDTPGERASAEARRSHPQQTIGSVGHGSVVFGPAASLKDVVFHVGGQEDNDTEPLRGVASGRDAVLVVGDVPQEPAAFQQRTGLMAALDHKPEGRISVVFAVTGIRGVGKTQVAAAYARWRITQGWRLVAWVDASDETSVVAGLAQVAVAAGVGAAGEDARVLAAGVRHWLEADGERRLVVFDNAADLDMLRPFLPAGGAAQVVVTSISRSAAGLGRPVSVDVFTEDEALAFLAERTGLDDDAGARELACELGWLPLGLAQAAALVARQHLSYRTYLERLWALPVAEYLQRAEGDAYPYRVAEAITLSVRAAEERDSSGVCSRLMGLVSVLAETGVSRRVLHLAIDAWGLRDVELGKAEVDAAVGDLADASLVGFTVDDSVVVHRLVMRVVRERLAAEGGLPVVLASAAQVLAGLASEITEAWRDPVGVRDLAGHLSTLVSYLASHPDALAGEMLAGLLRLRVRSVYLLNTLGDSTGLAILAAEPLVVDCERRLGTDHPDTVSARVNLGYAYRAAGRTTEATALYEQTLSELERVLGADHQHTLALRNNVAGAYQAAGRTAEAIPLFERTLAGRDRVLGADHPDTLASLNNLAVAYRAAGRTTEAIALYEQTLSELERVLGADHPDILTAQGNLATAYLAAGRTTEAIPLYEQTLAKREQVLGADHPSTLSLLNNLAAAYRHAERTAEAIPLLERTLDGFERVLGAGHPSTLSSLNNLAAAYLAAGRTTEAILILEQTLADCEQVLGRDHPSTLSLLNNLAVAYRHAERTAEEISLLERTLADCEQVLGPDHPDTLILRNNLATAYQDVGRTTEAILLLERTLADFERVLGADHPDTNMARENLTAFTGKPTDSGGK
jgi:tetratricopeptide (TPR) repeat protein